LGIDSAVVIRYIIATMTKAIATFDQAVSAFLDNLAGNTKKAYQYDLRNESSGFLFVMESYGVKSTTPISQLNERHGVQWVQWMWKQFNKSTIQRRLSAFKNFMRYCKFAYDVNVSVEQFSEILKSAKLQPKVKNRRIIPMEKIERVVTYSLSPAYDQSDEFDKLRALRDRAFIVCLADSGLRVSEACSLTRGDLTHEYKYAAVIGKGGKVGVVRFSTRAIKHIQSYLKARGKFDGALGVPLATLPLFANTTIKKCRKIGSQTGRKIVDQMARSALGPDYIDGEISPHSLRHYFVMIALENTGGDIKKVKELARHESIVTTELYSQVSNVVLNKSYDDIFNRD